MKHVLVEVFAYNGLVEPRSFFELALLHEEHMCYVQFPNIALIAGRKYYSLFNDSSLFGNGERGGEG